MSAPTFPNSSRSPVRELLTFVDLIRICSKISIELNSSGLEIFRIDRFGVDDIGLCGIRLITCQGDCQRETATLSEIVAVWSFIGSQMFIVLQKCCGCL